MSKVLTKVLNDEIRRNQKVIDMTRASQKGSVVGRLERQTHGKSTYFYLTYKDHGKRKRKCLGKADSDTVKAYVGELRKIERVKILLENNQALKELKRKMTEDSIGVIDARLPETCRGIRKEGFVDARLEELKTWAKADYKQNTKNLERKTHRACDGTLVRSKGEVIWYNLLYDLGIPFRYDPVIEVIDDMGRKVEKSPDFLIQCYDGSFIIIEHLGYLKDPGYCSDFATKTRYYLRKGYVLGVNYFVTSDDWEGNTNSHAITKQVQIVEQRFYGIT